MILPGANLKEAGLVAERMRMAIRSLNIPSKDGRMVSLTASLGAASAVLGEEFSLERLIEGADQALYMSKEAGRDRVSIFPM